MIYPILLTPVIKDAKDVRRVVGDKGPITLRLGKVAIFPGKEYDVVYISVDSPDLEDLNVLLADKLPISDTARTHEAYVPHITLAYVKSGEGEQYVGDDTFEGVEFQADRIMFSDTKGNVTEIELSGGVEKQTKQVVKVVKNKNKPKIKSKKPTKAAKSTKTRKKKEK